MNRILLFLICLSALAAKAQTTQMAYDGRLAVTVSRMALSGQTLELNLELQLLQALKTGKTLEVTPVLTDGTSSAVFSTITFMGRNKMREYHRSIALGNALADELAHIHDLMDEVGQSDGIVISRIDVVGYASPEGSVRNNLMLSANRARSMATYIADKYHLPATLFASQSGGEDWQGLDSLVRLDPAVRTCCSCWPPSRMHSSARPVWRLSTADGLIAICSLTSIRSSGACACTFILYCEELLAR